MGGGGGGGTGGCPMLASSGNPKHNTIAGTQRMSSNPSGCPASYMSETMSAHSMPNHGSLTPTYHYIEEAICPQISPGKQHNSSFD